MFSDLMPTPEGGVRSATRKRLMLLVVTHRDDSVSVMEGPLRVFLSHTSELRQYPRERSFTAAAEQAIVRAGFLTLDLEYFTAREDKPADYCRQQVEQADVYVGILGFRYGSPVRDNPGRSYTELEFDKATELGRPRLLFLLDEDAILPLPRSFLSDPVYGERQAAFRARVTEAGITVGKVASPDRLEVLLFQALMGLRVQARERAIQDRQAFLPGEYALISPEAGEQWGGQRHGPHVVPSLPSRYVERSALLDKFGLAGD